MNELLLYGVHSYVYYETIHNVTHILLSTPPLTHVLDNITQCALCMRWQVGWNAA